MTLRISDQQRAAVEDEIVDVLIYLVRLADVTGIGLIDAANRKSDHNETRFPA